MTFQLLLEVRFQNGSHWANIQPQQGSIPSGKSGKTVTSRLSSRNGLEGYVMPLPSIYKATRWYLQVLL